MRNFAVWIQPPLGQTWNRGDAVLWSVSVSARSEAEARAKVRSFDFARGMPIVGCYPT
jgi:hypothetical protein